MSRCVSNPRSASAAPCKHRRMWMKSFIQTPKPKIPKVSQNPRRALHVSTPSIPVFRTAMKIDQSIRLTLRCCCALALVSQFRVEQGFLCNIKQDKSHIPDPGSFLSTRGVVNLIPSGPSRSQRFKQHLTPGSNLPGRKTERPPWPDASGHARTEEPPPLAANATVTFLFNVISRELVGLGPQTTDPYLTAS